MRAAAREAYEEIRVFTPGDTEAMRKIEVKVFNMRFVAELLPNLVQIEISMATE